jgi:hypothetical protein
MHERIANESQLSIVQGVTTPAEVFEYMGYRFDLRPVGKGWRVLIYAPGTGLALPEYASNLEKGSRETVVKEAKKIVDAHLDRKLNSR